MAPWHVHGAPFNAGRRPFDDSVPFNRHGAPGNESDPRMPTQLVSRGLARPERVMPHSALRSVP